MCGCKFYVTFFYSPPQLLLCVHVVLIVGTGSSTVTDVHVVLIVGTGSGTVTDVQVALEQEKVAEDDLPGTRG